MNICIYIYIGLRWPPAATYNCAQVHHRSPAGTFTRVPGRCLRWSPTSQGPRWPPANICILIEVLHLYRCVTQTPCLWQGSATEDEVKMKMRGKWRWGDHEDEMKTYLTRTRRGERKRRRREHQHNTPGPERADPGKARKKKSGGSTDTEQDQRRGGGRKRLNQPDTAKPTNTSARDGTNLPGEGRTHEIGDQWGLVDEPSKN